MGTAAACPARPVNTMAASAGPASSVAVNRLSPVSSRFRHNSASKVSGKPGRPSLASNERRPKIGDELLQFVHRTPNPRATTPRNTSLVPPRRVNSGECSRAVANSSASRSASGVRRSTRSNRSAANSTESCSKRVPRSFTSAARVAASSPPASARATEIDSWRKRDHPSDEFTHRRGGSVVDIVRQCPDGGEDQGDRGQDAFGSAALEAQLGGDLPPAIADAAQHVGIGDEHVVERHLVEVVFATHLHDRIDGDAR